MTTLIGAREAAHLLGVSRATLYAYVSRRTVSRQLAIDGRTSLYDRGEIEALASRSRRRVVDRPSIDVQIATDVTRLHDEGPTIRGLPLLDLAKRCSYEQIAELLMTGTLPAGPVIWRPERDVISRTRAARRDGEDPITTLSMAALDVGTWSGARDAATVGRTLLSIAPSVFGGPARGDLATRLTRTWVPSSSSELVAAVSLALVLLADHELATSTIAVRLAASVRAAPSAALATGLNVVGGSLHGAASRQSSQMFRDAALQDGSVAVRERLTDRRTLPGFGHAVYRNGDPRFAPLMDAVRAIPGSRRCDVVESVLVSAAQATGDLPNVDLALAALTFVGGLPDDAPLFAIARIAGWVAHYDEELGERPLRFRGLATGR